jgi:hypothetical protein
MGIPEVLNVLPAADGYIPFKDTTPGTITTGPTVPTGLWSNVDSGGNHTLFAGDDAKLYKANTGTDVWDDVSRAGSPAYAGGTNHWYTAQYNDLLIAVNGVDDIQEWDLGVDSAFSDMATGVTDLTGRFITIAEDFVIIGNTYDNADGNVPNRLRWSGLARPDSWTPDATTMAGYRDIPNLGEICGVTGGSYLTVLMKGGLLRGQFIGPPGIWRLYEIEGAVGCLEPHSVIRTQNKTYYLSEEGFMEFDGVQTRNIGAEKVNRTFFRLAQVSELHQMSPFVLREHNVVGWSFVSSVTPDGKPDRAILYNYVVDRFTMVELDLDIVGTVSSPGYTMDGLSAVSTSVDDLPASLDDRMWKGGGVTLGGLRDGTVYFASGNAKDATLETREVQLADPQTAIALRADAIVSGDATLAVQVGTRDQQNVNKPDWSAEYFQNPDGFIPLRSQGRYHRFRLNISGGYWKHAKGVKIMYEATGMR